MSISRYTVSIMALTLASSAVLAGCGSGGSANNAGTNQNNGSGKAITLTEMDYFTTPPGNTIMPKLISDFEKTHPNIKIQRQAVPFGNLLPKALQEASTHSLPDILQLDNPQLQQFASTGALVPLSTFTNFDKSQFYPGPLSTVTYNGQIYGLPIGNNDVALIYNKTLFKKAHLTPPTTWSELIADAKTLTHGSTYGIAFSAPNEEENTWQFEPFLWSNGGHIRTISAPNAAQALNVWTNLVHNGYASKSVLNWTQADVQQQFDQGNAAMEINGPWNLQLLKQSGIDYGIAPIPVPKAGDTLVVPLGGEVFTIPKSTSAKEKAAWTFVSWMLQNTQNLISTDTAFHYIPAYIPAAKVFLKSNPEMTVFANEIKTGRARTEFLAANYPTASQAVWTAIQAAIAGTQSPASAFKQAQSTINQLPK